MELLCDKKYRNIIKWQGNQGEFKLVDAEKVASLWGALKNNPRMNYTKMARAMRFYYGGDILSKVEGERFTYKFMFDLKEAIGHDANELSDMVNDVPRL